MNFTNLSPIRKLGIAYAIMFFFIASLQYIPGVADENGSLWGLFTLDLYDDALHFFSGVWALIAALISTKAAVNFFKIFGIVYGLDGVMGLILGQAYLDGGIFIFGPTFYPFIVRFGANLPHIFIGGLAVWIGFVLAKRVLAAEEKVAAYFLKDNDRN